MRGRIVLAVAALSVGAGLVLAPAGSAAVYRDSGVYARVTRDRVVLGNALAERRWSRGPFRTLALVDRRGRDRRWSAGSRDFTLSVGPATVGSDLFRAGSVAVAHLPRGGLRVTFGLSGPGGLGATRVAEAYPGVAGFRTQTTLTSTAPFAISGATLDEAGVGRAAPSISAFHAGTDWRDPNWEGPPLEVGSSNTGDVRVTRDAAPGAALDADGEWISMADRGRTLFMVAERNDLPSSRAAYDGASARLQLDFTRDVIDLGPFEEQAHVENPLGTAGRARTIEPGAGLALPAEFTGFGDHPGDEPWQFHRYLVGHRLDPYPKTVAFNSNGTDSNRISSGAKDDMDYATVQQVAPIARRLGIETFVLDDGWQAESGDWQPDSPQYPDGRYPPRFPDATFSAVRSAIAPMRLGLWMSPTAFNPQSQAFHDHPDWACTPVGDATALDNLLDPTSGSNEAGIGFWSPAAFPFVESRIRDAIEHWGVSYFKFDFMVWADCAGAGDMYAYHDAFVAMVDRLKRDFPGVTFEIDETNDYRMFPFESAARGPTWFQNGTPQPDQLLHNIWKLSPYVPAFALGQAFLGGEQWKQHPVDTLMAAALTSSMTFFSDLRDLPGWVIDRAAPWVSFYEAHRADFTRLVYPLLDDPLRDGWTALQSWDPAAGRGALLAFRQQSDSPARTIALANVPRGRRFDLYSAPDGAYAGTVSSARLQRGLVVDLPQKDTARVLLIEPPR